MTAAREAAAAAVPCRRLHVAVVRRGVVREDHACRMQHLDQQVSGGRGWKGRFCGDMCDACKLNLVAPSRARSQPFPLEEEDDDDDDDVAPREEPSFPSSLARSSATNWHAAWPPLNARGSLPT